MYITTAFYVFALLSSIRSTRGVNVILSNDDGWAELNVRQFFDALTSSPFNFNVVLSAPSENKSGTGSTDVPPTVLNTTCEFNTCPVGSPAEGFNQSDPRLNYVNSFPVTSMNFGIATLAPKLFNSTQGVPDIAVAGPNVGLNSGSTTLISGTVGATTAAALKGIPAIAFSGSSGSQVAYTSSLSQNHYAVVYAALSANFTNTLLQGAETFPSEPILPQGIWLNVNLSPSSSRSCSDASDFTFVMTRINSATSSSGADLTICDNGGRLPTEDSVLNQNGCFVTVSVGDASTKGDVSSDIQQNVFERIQQILTCL